MQTNHRGTEVTEEYNTEKTKDEFKTVMPRNQGIGFLCVVFLCDLCASVVRFFLRIKHERFTKLHTTGSHEVRFRRRRVAVGGRSTA